MLCLAFALGANAGCGGQVAPSGSSPATTTAAEHTPEVVVTDDLGREVRFSSHPRRIVSLVPSSTEIVFALGAGDRLVGVTEYCDFPAQAQDVAKVGGFTAQSVSLESILHLRPDAVLATGKLHQLLIAELERWKIPVVALEPELFADVYNNIRLLGQVTGTEEAAQNLVEQMQSRVREVRVIAEQIPTSDRLRVFYQVWDEPLMAATNHSFIGEMISMAGAENVFADLQQRSPQVSEEAVLDRDPQVIIAPSGPQLDDVKLRLRNRSGWANIAALRNDRIHLVPADPVSRPGPRLVEGLLSIAHAIYPERYP